MKCVNEKPDLLSFAEGLLSDEESMRVEKHLEECQICHGFVNELKSIAGIIESERDVHENPFFYTRVEERMFKPAITKGYGLHRLVPTLIATLFFIGGVFAGINIGKLYGTAEETGVELSFETKQYLDDLAQEPIESYLINLNSTDYDKE